MGNIAPSIGMSPFASANPITINLYKTSDPNTIAVTQTKTRPETLDITTWVFPGLERTNYIFKVFEQGNPVPLFKDTFIPNSNGFKYKQGYLITVGVTAGWVAGNNSVTLDGTDGKDDWKGWDIVITRIGSDIMKEGIDYNYNPSTGLFGLVQEGDQLGDGEYFFVQFDAQVDEGGGLPDQIYGQLWNQRRVITGTDSIAADDAGKKIIIKGESNYFVISLPALVDVQENKLYYIESAKGVHKCSLLQCDGDDIVDWLEGDLPGIYICQNENLQLYKEVTDDGPVWRVHSAEGNFLTVGEDVGDDMDASHVFNKVLLDGSLVSVDDHARLYNRYVLRLPAGQTTAFGSWPLNKTKFSLADGSGHFYLPDRTGWFERNASLTQAAATTATQSIQSHDHTTHGKGEFPTGYGDKYLSKGNNHFSGGGSTGFGGSGTPDENIRTGDTGGAETRPANVAVNRYKRL